MVGEGCKKSSLSGASTFYKNLEFKIMENVARSRDTKYLIPEHVKYILMSEKKCTQCGKLTEKWTLRQGKAFCSQACVKKYGETHSSKKSGVCEFC